MKNFQNRADFTDDLEKLTGVSVLTMTSLLCDITLRFSPLKETIMSTLFEQDTGDFADIREEVINEEEVTKGNSSFSG